MSLPNHRQVATSREGVLVDYGLRSLLESLWALGMPTEFSCQNFGYRRRGAEEPSSPAYGYIAFTHFEHAVRFVRESRVVFSRIPTEPGLLCLESGGERAFVDFPAYKLLAITAYWRRQADKVPDFSREVSAQGACDVSRETSAQGAGDD